MATSVQMSSSNGSEGTVASRYAKLETIRAPYLRRARDAARLTIPMLMPPQGNSAASKFDTPYQSLGARGVNNLSSKLLLTLVPPNTPFFVLKMPDEVLAQLGAKRGDVEEQLSRIERRVLEEINNTQLRVYSFEAFKQLVNSGNVLLYLPDEGGMKLYRLDRYTVKRDPMGTVLEIITRDDIHPSTLTPSIRQACGVTERDLDAKSVSLYTYVKLNEDGVFFDVSQELNGIEIPNSRGKYRREDSPFLALRMIMVDNEDYGRSYVEEYIGDLKSLEGLSKSIVEGSAAMAKLLFMVNPNGVTKKKTIAEAPNTAVVDGNAADVTVLQAGKSGDFRVALDTINGLLERLGQAFLMNSSVQRSGERVTAEEIRYLAKELEDALGGIYAVQSQEFQLPLVRRVMTRLQKQGAIPQLPEGSVKPTIVTGMEALGRSQELDNLRSFVADIAPLGADVLKQYLSVTEYIKRVGANRGIDMKGLVRTEEEVQQAQQQDQMMAMAQNVAPKAMDIAAQQQQNPQG